MQPNISTCKALNHWKASAIACGFVNKLLPRTEKIEFLIQDKEELENCQSDTGLPLERNLERRSKTNTPRMGRMKKTPMRVGPGLVGNNHPSKLAAMELSAEQNNGHWNVSQNHPPSIKIESIDNYPQTSTPKYSEPKDPSRPTSEHSSSSMSEQSFKSDYNMEDTKLVIVTEKNESPWMASDVKPIPNCMITANQEQRPWISSDLPTSPVGEFDKERVKARTFSFGDSQMSSGESMEVGNQVKDELDSSIDGGKTIRATKIMRCKQCDTEHVGKENLWQHLRDVHPKENHLLCDYCPFATRYRHHYEYHIRNHRGEKPFKCEQCGYRCVNKSMLASHMKSHTTIYEYKCDTCSYETKYYHSLKQHLEKTNHYSSPEKTGLPKKLITDSPCDRGNDLSSNGNMLPMPSGPPLSMLNGVNLLPPPPPLHNPFSQNAPDKDAVPTSGQMLDHASFQPPFLNSPAKSNNFPLMNHSASAIVGSLVPNPSIAMQIQNTMSLLYSEGRKLTGMDQAQSLLQDAILASHLVDIPSDLSVPQQQPKRKPIKTEQLVDREEGTRLKVDSFVKREGTFDINSNDDKILEASRFRSGFCEKSVTPSSGYGEEISLANLSYCKYCKVYFVDPVAYQVHAGNHNFDDPFKCNRCGHRAKDAISFMSHGLCSKQ